MQSPSSLIFLVLLGIWAAYFVQYWVRRREHLATAQSVDQFSETMRVLERRSPLPATDLSAPARPSYAVSPARAVRAQVLVKRAETTTFTRTPAGVVTPGAAPAAPTAPGRSGGREAVEPQPVGRSADVGSVPVVRPARAVRGLTLLAALAAFVIALPLAAFGIVPWLGVLVPLAVAVGAMAWLRQAVAAEQAARREVRRTGSSTRAAAHPAARQAASAPVATVDEGEPAAARVRPELYDVQEVERELATPAPTDAPRGPVESAPAAAATAAQPAAVVPRPLVDEDDIPLTWDPVPVPRPTYTMKSRATRPAPTSADLIGDADTEYARYEHEHEQEPVRRVVGG